MPIPVPPLTVLDGPAGIPDRLLRPLYLSRATQSVDPDDGSVSTVWTSEEFLGRITRGQTTEATDDGRQGAVDTIKLLTNVAGIRPQDRIIEQSLDQVAWEVIGQPVAVWAASAIHHYEAPLRRVDG